MTDLDPEQRVRQLVEQARLRREQDREVRAAFSVARAAGLRRRHQAKLARLRGDVTDLESLPEDDGPTAA
ncbi:hypothetical protein OG216_23565 [Streptomycetaceae bacterium NBC_01309]